MLQVIAWLRTHLEAADSQQVVEAVAQHDEHFANALELAVRFGKVRARCRVLLLGLQLAWRVNSAFMPQVLLVTEVDAVAPILHPLLRRDVEKQAGRMVSLLGRPVQQQLPHCRANAAAAPLATLAGGACQRAQRGGAPVIPAVPVQPQCSAAADP